MFSLIVYLLFFYQYEIRGIIIVKILAHFINALMLLIFINGKDYLNILLYIK